MPEGKGELIIEKENTMSHGRWSLFSKKNEDPQGSELFRPPSMPNFLENLKEPHTPNTPVTPRTPAINSENVELDRLSEVALDASYQHNGSLISVNDMRSDDPESPKEEGFFERVCFCFGKRC